MNYKINHLEDIDKACLDMKIPVEHLKIIGDIMKRQGLFLFILKEMGYDPREDCYYFMFYKPFLDNAKRLDLRIPLYILDYIEEIKNETTNRKKLS